MQRLFSLLLLNGLFILSGWSQSLDQDLKRTYALWHKSMVSKDIRIWDSITASHRKQTVRNLIYSEKFSYPQEVFVVPFLPPALDKLKLLQVKERGMDGKAVFFGKVDFGVGGDPTDNLLVVSYRKEAGHWRFGGAEYINLSALPKVRTEIAGGNYSYLKQPDFEPSTPKIKNAVKLSSPVSIIGKTYSYCPGREVKAIVNNISNHLFQNTKEAEVVIGGLRPGLNEIQMAIKKLPGGQGNEPLCLRVYAMSKVKGTKPVKIFEYLVEEKGSIKSIQTAQFHVTREIFDQLNGK